MNGDYKVETVGARGVRRHCLNLAKYILEATPEEVETGFGSCRQHIASYLITVVCKISGAH